MHLVALWKFLKGLPLRVKDLEDREATLERDLHKVDEDACTRDAALESHVRTLRTNLKASTDISVDCHMDGMNTIIVIGRYQNADYIQTYDIRMKDLQELVDYLRVLENHGTVRRIDAVPGFRAIAEKSL